MKSAQADAAKLQAELALTNFEGFSSDETVKATVDGSQARERGKHDAVVHRCVVMTSCSHASRLKRASSAARSPRGAISPKLLWNKAPSACLCLSTRRMRMHALEAWLR